MFTKFGSKRCPRSLDIHLDIDGSVAAEDDIDEPEKNICQIWTVEGTGLKLDKAVEDAYGQVSTKFGSKRCSRSLNIDSDIACSVAAANDVDEH